MSLKYEEHKVRDLEEQNALLHSHLDITREST